MQQLLPISISNQELSQAHFIYALQLPQPQLYMKQVLDIILFHPQIFQYKSLEDKNLKTTIRFLNVITCSLSVSYLLMACLNQDPNNSTHCNWFLFLLRRLLYGFLLLLLFSLATYLLKKLCCFPVVSHSLDFADCFHVMLLNKFLCPCIFCKLVVRSSGLIKFKLL